MKKVRAQVSTKGEINLEFVGFAGEECTGAREELKKVLLELGVMLDPQQIRKKTASEISRELSPTSKPQTKVEI